MRKFRDLSYETVHQTRTGYVIDAALGKIKEQFSYGDMGGYVGGVVSVLLLPINIPIEFRRSFDRNFTQKIQ